MVIMTALEAVNVFAIKRWFPGMLFAVSLMFTVSLMVLVRWNFLAAIFTVSHGVVYCAFLSVFQTVGYEEYIIYAVGLWRSFWCFWAERLSQRVSASASLKP